jgi:hypothetical protein
MPAIVMLETFSVDSPPAAAEPSAAAGLGTGFLVSTFWSRLPEEDLYEALREERRVSEVPLSFSITPTANGAVLGLSGRF